MSCHALLTALRDHAAGADPTPSLTAHLSTCPACAEALDAERRLLAEVDAFVGGVASLQPSPALLARARSLAAATSRPRWYGAGLWAAVAVLGVGLSALLLRETPPLAPAGPLPRVPEPVREARAPEAVPAATVTGPARRPPPSPPRVRPALVPPGQEEALLRLAALVRSGAVGAPPGLVEPDDPERALVPSPELDLPLLNIEALPKE